MSRRPPVARVGDYRVLDFVGAGGMGEVFRAVHDRSGQVAAVKFLTGNAELSTQAQARWRERFIHEARVQSSLRHPNLTAFYEWHEVGSTPCIVMEFVDGQTLASRLQSGALPLSEALNLFEKIVGAVAFMHKNGVIHRDIKSGNVKINSKGEVKLLDFGIAKSGDTPRLTTTGAFVGTLQYLSPEQVKGADADARCDVWALGALLYEMLCGQPPFGAGTWGELVEKVTRANYEPLGARCAGLPREVENIVRRCLQKNPHSRYESAIELSSALKKFGAGNADSKAETQHSPAQSELLGRLKPNTPMFALGGGVGALVLLAVWMAWPTQNTIIDPSPTPAPTTANATNKTERDPNSGETDSTPTEEEWRTLTVDVFEGASQTQIFRDNQLIDNAPCQLRGRIGEKIDIKLSRPGFRDRYETITVTPSRSVYSFNMESASP